MEQENFFIKDLFFRNEYKLDKFIFRIPIDADDKTKSIEIMLLKKDNLNELLICQFNEIPTDDIIKNYDINNCDSINNK